MQTQMMEGARVRRTDETTRRNLQQRTAKNQRIWAEQKIIAREMSKRYLTLFKRDTLSQLVDEGILRRHVDFSMESHFLPQLYNQVQFDLSTRQRHIEILDHLVGPFTMKQMGKTHKEAIKKEFLRREEKKREELRL